MSKKQNDTKVPVYFFDAQRNLLATGTGTVTGTHPNAHSVNWRTVKGLTRDQFLSQSDGACIIYGPNTWANLGRIWLGYNGDFSYGHTMDRVEARAYGISIPETDTPVAAQPF